LAHLIVVVGLFAVSMTLLIEGQYAQVFATLAINIPCNIYPIMLQRYNRDRVNKLLARYG
jgi:hypothetical protein